MKASYDTFASLPEAARSEAAEFLRRGVNLREVHELLLDDYHACLSLEALYAARSQPVLPTSADTADNAAPGAPILLQAVQTWILQLARGQTANSRLLSAVARLLVDLEKLDLARHRLANPSPSANSSPADPTAPADYNRPFTPEEARAVIYKIEHLLGPTDYAAQLSP